MTGSTNETRMKKLDCDSDLTWNTTPLARMRVTRRARDPAT
jgi:hypothetical protein